VIGDALVVDVDEAAGEVPVILDQPVTDTENIHSTPPLPSIRESGITEFPPSAWELFGQHRLSLLVTVRTIPVAPELSRTIIYQLPAAVTLCAQYRYAGLRGCDRRDL
jgi:hypothetical protein